MYTLTDLIVRVWLTGRVPSVPTERYSSAPRRQTRSGSCPSIQPEVNRREYLAPTAGHGKTWSHLHFWLSLLTWWETQGKARRDLKEVMPPSYNNSWMPWGLFRRPTKSTDENKNESKSGSKKKPRLSMRGYKRKPELSRKGYKRNPSWAGEATSESPSWAREATRETLQKKSVYYGGYFRINWRL